ncbi:hypothetical protein [Defluviitalea phaphyphila]|uniref:hypothetical protein n=1 Tax=Defluviitalea phaphyphila TaxID=1473580 RepID=UPI001FA77727|nr:hypothetical protein [Defluviitalea phaphyphila]
MRKIVENPKFKNFTIVLYPLLFGLLIFLLWQTGGLNILFNTDTNTLPPPSKINGIIFDNIGKIMINLKATIIVALGGLFLGSIIGYLIAVIATIFPKWGAGGLTLSSAFNAIPIIALAPVMNNLTKKLVVM